MMRLPVTTAECSSPQARWITASSRIQNLLSKKRLLPNVNTAPESATKREGITQHGTYLETRLHHDQSYLQHFMTILKEIQKSKLNKPGTSSSSDAILVSTQETPCWPIIALLALLPPKHSSSNVGKSSWIFVTFPWVVMQAASMAVVRVLRGCYRLNSSISKVVKGTEPFFGHYKAIGALPSMKRRYCSER